MPNPPHNSCAGAQAETASTAPLKTLAYRLFSALTDVELLIASCLVANVIFAADRLAGVIQ